MAFINDPSSQENTATAHPHLAGQHLLAAALRSHSCSFLPTHKRGDGASSDSYETTLIKPCIRRTTTCHHIQAKSVCTVLQICTRVPLLLCNFYIEGEPGKKKKRKSSCLAFIAHTEAQRCMLSTGTVKTFCCVWNLKGNEV